MVLPLKLREQEKLDLYLYTEVLVVYFSSSNFDKVFKRNEEGEIIQGIPDIPDASPDCELFQSVMAQY